MLRPIGGQPASALHRKKSERTRMIMRNGSINVGIIGVHPNKGWASLAHIPALRALPAFRVTAISHNQMEVAKAAAEKFGIEHALLGADALVNHPDVDLVVVAVKVTRHKELVTKAIAAGKAVFCEWPLGTNLAEATAIRDLARSKGVRTAIGLQTRASPTFSYVRDLIRDGYVGEVLSVTMIGSGITLGESMSEQFAYTLDPANGVGMEDVPFAHSIDGLLYALDSELKTVSGTFMTRRKTIRIEETGVDLPMTVPDQMVVTGTMANGTVLSAHFRGGLSRATNFRVEINGRHGDLVIASPVGYVGIGGFTLRVATGDGGMEELLLPERYRSERFPSGPSNSVAANYARLASDISLGTSLAPTFDDAVALHRLIDATKRSQSSQVHL